MRHSTRSGAIVAVRFNGEAAMLLAALFAVVWLRLALPAINFGQPIMHGMHGADAMASMMQLEDHAAAATDSQTPSDQRCRDTMPGCDSYLQGLCPFAPVFLVTGCASFSAPLLPQAAPPFISADDRSPPGSALKIPPRP